MKLLKNLSIRPTGNKGYFGGKNRRLLSFSLLIILIATSAEVFAQTNKFPPDGNTGIGTANPTAKLHIIDGNNTFKFNRGALNVTPNISIGTSGGKSFAVVAGLNGTGAVFDNTGTFMISGDTKANIDGGGTSGGISYLTVTGSGFVGIGTTSPQELLSVNGIIKSKEVKVEGGIWPDYVFEESYSMLALPKVEAFIKANKHLPGIPNRQQVQEQGVGLGEMNRKLLEKIEEVTLILIENEKIRNQQADKIAEQERRIEKLEKFIETK